MNLVNKECRIVQPLLGAKAEQCFREVTACFWICDLEFGILPGIWVLGFGISTFGACGLGFGIWDFGALSHAHY